MRIKRAFKKIEDIIYIVNVYLKENIYTFELINFDQRRKCIFILN